MYFTNSNKAASEKREAMEKKLRAKLEDELKDFRQEKESGTNNRNDGDIDIEQVTRKLSACEEKVKTTTILFDYK